jgi:hypothetical protein
LLSLTPGPHSSVSLPSPSFLLSPASPACRRSRADPAAPRLSPFLLSSTDLPIKAFNRPGTIGVVSPFLAPSRDGRGHQWQAPLLGARPPPFAFLPALLFKPVLDRLQPQFPSATASGSCRRRAFVTAGEGPPPPPPFSSLWVHQGLIKLNWLQVPVLGARGCRASSMPERRPSCRRCQAPPLLNPLHLRARPLHL